MSPGPLIVIFGAAVDQDGAPSAALRRRISSGREAARRFPSSSILCSGGGAGTGPTEASVIADRLLADGVAAERLILDELSQTTRDNVAAAVRTLERLNCSDVIACSDRYHLPRVHMLLWLNGVRSQSGPVPAGLPGVSVWSQVIMGLREALAIPVYLAIFVIGRARNRP